MTSTAAEKIADHFVHLKFKDLPAERIRQVKTLVKDYLGVALGGSRTDSGKVAAGFAKEIGGAPQATVIGNGARVPAVHAAFANAIASHSIELDDVDYLALFHFSPPVVSAALAVAEQEGASGKEFLAAVIAGCEMMSRASHATNFSLRDRGFHTTPTCGVFGAAIASAYLMRLNGDQFVSSLGLAGAQSSGLMEMYGPSMQKRFNPGPAARNGVTSAWMARLGFTGAATIFDGERGFCRAFSDEFDVSALTADLGPGYPDEFEYKPYSCARPIHNAIDCALNIRKELKEPLSAVKSISMRRHPKWAEYHKNAHPKTYHEAQVSLPYSVAVALIEGAALFPQYSNDKLGDAEIIRLSTMVDIVSDDSLPRGVSCLMELKTEGGNTLTSQVDHPSGSIENPMTPEQMNAKVHLLADPVVGKASVDALIAAVDHLEDAESVTEVIRNTIPSALGA
ncbi:MmgE/PrpD family protein [Oleispirillum naphthae]|uniref:MmgE/PrpD family protein n=1 Tax=Oleispirillum naphthae TaxID=2838853 RepID=UPI0030822B3B